MAYLEHTAAGGAVEAHPNFDIDKLWAEYIDSPKAKRHTLKPHDVVFYESDPADRLYELISGSVMLYKLLPDGRRQVVEILGPGDLFGLHGGKYFDCTAESLTNAEIRVLNRRDIDHSLGLQQHVGRCLIAKMESMHDHAMLLGRKSAMERVASFLMRLVPNRGMIDCPGPAHEIDEKLVELSMTRQEIADYLGLTIETVSRAISELKRRGLVRIEKQDKILITRVCGICKLTGMH